MLFILPVFIAACTASTPIQTGRLPRANRVSAADLQRGEGTDICDRFDKPVLTPFKPASGSALGVLPGEHFQGPANALDTIMVYIDFTCEKCKALAESLNALIKDDPDVRVVVRHLPVGEASVLAAKASEAAATLGGEDGFWAMHDQLFEHQSEWIGLKGDALNQKFSDYATAIGLDGAALVSSLNDEVYKNMMDYAPTAAQALKVTAAPAYFVDDLPVTDAPIDLPTLKLILNVVRMQRTYSKAPPMQIDPTKDYVAWITTEHGDIAVDLYADLAPETVNNFAYLACTGFYDNITWHRVLPGFVAQTGDPSGSGFGGPGYTIHDEFKNSDLIFDKAGWLSMAHTSAPDSASSQFFITTGPTENLNGSFTIFGKVVGGQSVVLKITPRDPSQSSTELPPGDKLITIIVREVAQAK
jgi:cyclophilin family peptidyl-prolyl cis-trans isomerase/protein-disulfide isomerase